MSVFTSIWDQISALFSNIFLHADWHNILDIGIVSFIVYQIMRLFIHTRASSLLKGVGMLLLLTWISEVLQLNALNWLLLQIISTGAVLLVVLFQPELRRGLETVGRSTFWSALFTGTAQKDAERDAHELTQALVNLAKRHVGALVVIERETGLDDVAQTGTKLDALISAPLVEQVFEPNTPLHDGAMIIRKRRIVAAACILPLSDDRSISRELGTRHRAGIGTSETTDAVTLIVSEETGIISMARDGRLSRHMDAKSLTTLLNELFAPGDEGMLRNAIKSATSKRKGGGSK